MNRVQHWEAVRSQIHAHMARREVPADVAVARPDIRPVFRLEEAEPYYGPTRDAREAINAIFGLPSGACQGEWNLALLAQHNLDRLVDALGEDSLDTEARSAIALVLLEHVERSAMQTELVARIRWQLRKEARVQSRMRYWWTHMEGGPAVMEALS
nr:hypothetical protein [Sphingomonas sp.]